MHCYLFLHSLIFPAHSENLKFHSASAALPAVHNDFKSSVDKRKVMTLVVDLSVGFDTVDHSLHLHCLQRLFEVSCPALNFLSNYSNYIGYYCSAVGFP